jgi:PAS domain S-box-containing protein
MTEAYQSHAPIMLPYQRPQQSLRWRLRVYIGLIFILAFVASALLIDLIAKWNEERPAVWLMAGGITLIGLASVMIIDYLLNRFIWQPIECLRTGLQRLTQGDLAHRIELGRPGQVGEVMDLFNQLAAQLEDRERVLLRTQDELELRVVERTDTLRDSAERIRLITDNLPALIAYVDNQQVYQFANRQFEEWYKVHDIAGKHLRDIAGAAAYEGILANVEKALEGHAVTFEYSRVYPDQKLRHVQISYIPHRGPDGLVLGFFTLVQDLTERRRAEEQIRASLEEKVVLLKEIHHRVKNNLQVISSLLYLQAGRIKDQPLREILQDSQNRVRSMALIHEKLYQANDLANVDLAEYVRNLTGFLLRSYAAQVGSVQLHVKVQNVFLGIDTAMPCGLLINELVSNALKHAFPAGTSGRIDVEIDIDEAQRILLRVSDNGIGFPQEIDFQNIPSLGLQLVVALVGQLDGTIELNRNGGAEFLVRFSEAK